MLRIEIRKNLVKGAPERLRRALYGVTRRMAEEIRDEARQNILRHQLIDTGYLYSSIVAQSPPDRIYNRSEVLVRAPYGIFHEFGTTRHPARPFLLPAVQAVEPRYAELVRIAVERTFSEAPISDNIVALDIIPEAAYFGGDL